MLTRFLGKDYRRRQALAKAAPGPLADYLATPFPDRHSDCREIEIVAIDLETTGQRKVAYAALAVGGGALASSAALLGVTLDAQRRALAIEAARFEGSITAADEQARVDLVARRDSLRAATVATGVTGLALLTSGVILLLVDRPAVRSRLHGPGELARRVSVAPGLASLTLRAEF